MAKPTEEAEEAKREAELTKLKQSLQVARLGGIVADRLRICEERNAKLLKMLRQVVDWQYNRQPFQECLLSILRRAKALLDEIGEESDAEVLEAGAGDGAGAP